LLLLVILPAPNPHPHTHDAMKGGLAFACLAALLCLAGAALPPGYEDRLFCPPTYCLQPKPATADGEVLVGPKSLMWR